MQCMEYNMTKDIEIKEIVPVDLEGGTLVNGFPSSGITSAIATESLINTSNFELQANIDSDKFPPISVIKNGMPNYATRIFVNRDLKVGIFSSFLTLDVTMHRTAARMMLDWAEEKKCSTIVSSITVKGSNDVEVFGVASTGNARGKLVENVSLCISRFSSFISPFLLQQQAFPRGVEEWQTQINRSQRYNYRWCRSKPIHTFSRCCRQERSTTCRSYPVNFENRA